MGKHGHQNRHGAGSKDHAERENETIFPEEREGRRVRGTADIIRDEDDHKAWCKRNFTKCKFCGEDPPDHAGRNCRLAPSLKPCLFCGDPFPRHIGRNCPKNPENASPTPNESLNSRERRHAQRAIWRLLSDDPRFEENWATSSLSYNRDAASEQRASKCISRYEKRYGEERETKEREREKTTQKKTQNKQPKAKVKRSGITPQVKMSAPKTSIQWGQDVVRISGEDWVDVMEFVNPEIVAGMGGEGTRNFAGAVIFCQYLNPWRLPGTRLTQFANLFTRFKFTMANVRFVPSVPATTAGQIVAAWDMDATYAPTGPPQQVLRSLIAHKNRQFHHVFDEFSVALPTTQRDTYFCDTRGQDIRMNNQAVFWAALGSPIVGMNGGLWESSFGAFVLRWSVEFSVPKIDNGLQLTTKSQCIFSLVEGGAEGDLGVEYRLEFNSLSQPTTQTSMIIVQTVSGIVGLEKGSPYYIGSKLISSTNPAIYDTQAWWLFSSLRGAQQLDSADVIDLQRNAGTVTFCCLFYPIGPELSMRDPSRATTLTMLNLEGPGSPQGTRAAALSNTDPGTQAVEYLVNYSGISGPRAEEGQTAASLVAESPSGDYVVPVNESLVYRRIGVAKIMSFFNLNDFEFTNIFGFPPGEKVMIGALITAVGGFLIRVISLASTAVRVGMAIKKVLNETDDAFLARVDTSPTGFFAQARQGVFTGHELVLTPLFAKKTNNRLKQ